jgi:hypothetical protein
LAEHDAGPKEQIKSRESIDRPELEEKKTPAAY